MTMNRTLLSFDVTETDRNRKYWADRPWANSDSAAAIRSADIVLVPWENFREGKPALFPRGSADVFRALKEEIPASVITIGTERASYEEIALHGNEVRLPTILVVGLLLPTLAGVLSNRLDRWLPGYSQDSVVEVELIVEGPRGHCISIKYKGPRDTMIDMIIKQAERCLPKPTPDAKKPSKKGSKHAR